MIKCTSSFPKWIVSRRKVCVFALSALIILLVYIANNQTDRRYILKVNRPHQTDVIYQNNVTWMNFTNDIFRLYVYSAFYDDRPSLLSDPVIRIIAVSDPFEDINTRSATQLYCIMHYGGYAVALLMIDEPKAIGKGWELNKLNTIEYVYTCPSIKERIPTAVAISTTRDVNSSTCVPVTVPNKPEKQRDFCICPQAIYGLNLDPYRLIEWMELQKTLGVSLVGIHVLSASDSVLKILKHYAVEGFVELRKMNYIYSSVYDTEQEFWLHLTPAINDCIYRHMYEFRRIAVMDFDEIIMPRYKDNLPDLFSYLDNKNAKEKTRNVNYVFRNNYFFLDLPPDDTISPYLTFLRFRRKVELSPDGYAMKSIIDPQSCISMHNHFCWGLTANYSEYGDPVSVDPEIALNQHYKKCHFSHQTCDNMLENSSKDDVMLRLKDILTRNVLTKVKDIIGNDI